MRTEQRLNPQQQLAVRHQHGPLVVVAGAGSGKTRVIVHRLAHLIDERQISPRRILALTFTNQAASEMRDRVTAMVGEAGGEIQVGTFHWLGHRILRRYGAKLTTGNNFRLLSPGRSYGVLRAVVRTRDGDAANVGAIREELRAFRNMHFLREQQLHVEMREGREAICDLARAYRTALRDQNALDLDDLILETVALLSQHTDVRARLQGAFDHILVDEYQDTNPPQDEMLRLLVRSSGNLTVVGDDDQSIYGWRYANPDNMLLFTERFPAATVIRLEQNYRSTEGILRPANQLLRHNRRRLGKTLYSSLGAGRKPVIFAAGDEAEESKFAASTVEDLLSKGTNSSSIAILVRVHAQTRSLEDALVRQKIPYALRSNRKFYERAEIARIIESLNLLRDPGDPRAWGGVLGNLPGIGPARINTFSQALADKPDAGPRLLENFRPGNKRADRSLEVLRVWLSGPSRAQSVESRVRHAADLWEQIDRQAERPVVDDEDVRANVDEFISAAAEFDASSGAGLQEFLDRLALAEPMDGSNGVQIMTLHAAKGLEFDGVLLPGLEEGLLPHKRSLGDEAQVEEERRLLYVGMTRARQWLFLSYARTRLLEGASSLSQPSRFLDEMPASMFEIRHGVSGKPRDRLDKVSLGEVVLHARWGPGTVRGVEGAGRQTMVSITFGDGRQKRLQLCHAPLKRLS